MDYTCICCGTCCQKYQPWLTPLEVTEIAGRLNITPQIFIADYTDRRWPGTESYLLIHHNDACIFMQTSAKTGLTLCRIHAFKPASCRAWAPGRHKSECQSGLKNIFGITVDSSAQLQATDSQLSQLAERQKLIKALSTAIEGS